MAKPRAASRSGADTSFRIEAAEFSQLLSDAKAFDRDLGLRLRRGIREAAKPIVADVKRKVMEPSPGGGRGSGLKRQVKKSRSAKGQESDGTVYVDRWTEVVTEKTSVRKEIARGVGVKIGTGSKGGAVTIAASGRALPANRRAMLKAYNKKTWRHPTFGNRNVWQTQQGNPYFGATVLAHREQLRKAVEQALDEAATALGRKR